MKTLERSIVWLTCAAMTLSAAGPSSAQSLQAARVTIMRTYVDNIPAGSRVRITLADGKILRGVLMVTEGDDVIVRERKRLPEPPRRIPLEQIADVELDQNGDLGKAIAIGAGAGAAAALGVFFVILAALD
jgi:hypothetical protein